MQYVVEGWSAMLWGREDEIPTPCGIDTDLFNPLATGSRAPTEEHVLRNRQAGWGGILKWGLGYGVDMLLRAKENRIVCIPATFWQTQLNKALDELRAEALKKGEDPSNVFLTENDVLTAWILRCTVGEMKASPDTTVSLRIHQSAASSMS
jgi:hypothetical protein